MSEPLRRGDKFSWWDGRTRSYAITSVRSVADADTHTPGIVPGDILDEEGIWHAAERCMKWEQEPNTTAVVNIPQTAPGCIDPQWYQLVSVDPPKYAKHDPGPLSPNPPVSTAAENAVWCDGDSTPAQADATCRHGGLLQDCMETPDPAGGGDGEPTGSASGEGVHPDSPARVAFSSLGVPNLFGAEQPRLMLSWFELVDEIMTPLLSGTKSIEITREFHAAADGRAPSDRTVIRVVDSAV